METPFFFPAETIAEAVARIYSLTGAAHAGSRGEKRAVVALRDALGLDIDLSRTNVYMGRQVAEALGVEWRHEFESVNKINLLGLNALLEGATEAYQKDLLNRLTDQVPPGLRGPHWAAFETARSKIEAVNRISSLTESGPEWLGPGSKEHKSVLVNLARGLAPHLDTQRSKTRLAASLADFFNAPWSDLCESTGETISLIGLNTLLAGAERQLGLLGASRAMLLGTPEQEGAALAAALLDAWRPAAHPDGGKRVVWDGRSTVEWMMEQGLTNGPNQNEWQGFYWESRGRAVLSSAFAPNPSPPRTTYGNTTFDFSLRFVWDLKAHTESWISPLSGMVRRGRPDAPLNDQAAMNSCIEEQGLGFLMVGGRSVVDDDGSFVAWHRQFKATRGVRTKPSNSGRSNPRKTAFEPLHVEAFYFPNTSALEAAIAGGRIKGFAQGPQAPRVEGVQGSARKLKYNLNLTLARKSDLLVAGYDWPHEDRHAGA